MKLHERVLSMLRIHEGYCSGEYMARELQVSRNSIWKAVNRLKDEGYAVKSSTRNGYCLESVGNAMLPSDISAALEPHTKQLKLQIKESVTSTNDEIKRLAEEGVPEGTVLIAHEQTMGKGRLGRSFHSPYGTGLYMSILLRPAFSATQALFITTGAAVAVCRGIEAVTPKKAEIKWVNDIYIEGKKVCGILTEAATDLENGGLHYAVLGIGINVREPEEGFPEELRETAAALFQDSVPEGLRTKLSAAILNAFFHLYQALDDRSFMQEYKERSFFIGRRVRLLRGNTVVSGIVQDIDEEAAIIMELDSGQIERFIAGEVQIDKKDLFNGGSKRNEMEE